MTHRTASAAAALVIGLAVAGCSSTVSGEPGSETSTAGPASSAAVRTSAGSAAPSAVPAGDEDYTRYLLTQDDLPEGFEVTTEEPSTREDYVRSLGVADAAEAGLTIDPPQCLGYDPYGDLEKVRVMDATSGTPLAIFAQAAGPAGPGLASLRTRLAECATSTVSLTLPDGRTVTGSSTTDVLPDPDVGADEVLVLTVTDESTGPDGQDYPTTTQTLGFATVGSVVVGVRVIPVGPDPVDPAVATEVLTAAVALVRG